MRISRNIFILSLLVALGSCKTHYWSVQRSEAFLASKPEGNIISFHPIIEFRVPGKSLDAMKLAEKAEQFEKMARTSAKRNEISLDLKTIENNRSVLYYEQLLYLRKCIIDACFENYSSLYSNGGTRDNELVKSVYVYPPRLPFEVNNFSRLFGTRYYSMMRFQIYESSFTLQHVLINTDLAEVVYNERKTINSGYNKDLMAQAIYDSFALMRHEFNSK